MVPEIERHNRVISMDVPIGGLILPARSERVALILSIELFANLPAYIIGRSPDDGILFRLTVDDSIVMLCDEDIGDVIGMPVWSGANALMRARVSESWEIKTGRCVCPE